MLFLAILFQTCLFILGASKKVFKDYSDFRSNTYSSSLYGTWQNDEQFLYQSGDSLYIHNVIDKTDQLYYKDARLADAYDVMVTPSALNTFVAQIVIQSDKKSGYTHYVDTYTYTIIDVTSGTTIWSESGIQKWIMPKKVDNDNVLMSYVKDFNVHVWHCSTQGYSCLKDGITSHQITFDGLENVIFNGITDWMYAVEITDDDALVWFNDDNTVLAYGTLDQNDVKMFEYQVYGMDDSKIYPGMISFPYPSPGTKIPTTTVYFVDLETVLSGTFNQENFKTEDMTTQCSWKSTPAQPSPGSKTPTQEDGISNTWPLNTTSS